jgi:hypothetical protein
MALFSRNKNRVLGRILLVFLIPLASLTGQSGAGAFYGAGAAPSGVPFQNPYLPVYSNFYGNPWGQVPPTYFYPSMTPFPGIPPMNYFMPHFPSPYGPGNYCPTCNPYGPPPFIPQQNQSHWPIMS